MDRTRNTAGFKDYLFTVVLYTLEYFERFDTI